MQLASFVLITLIVCRIQAQDATSLTQQQPGSPAPPVNPVASSDNLTPGAGGTTPQSNPSGSGTTPTTTPTTPSGNGDDTDDPAAPAPAPVTGGNSSPPAGGVTTPTVGGNPTVSLSGAAQGPPGPSPSSSSGTTSLSGAGTGAGGAGAGTGGTGAGGSTQEPQRISLTCSDAYLPLSQDDLEAMANEGGQGGAAASQSGAAGGQTGASGAASGTSAANTGANDPTKGYLKPNPGGSTVYTQAACKGPQTKKGGLCSFSSCKVNPANPPICKKCKLADPSSFPDPNGGGQGQAAAAGAPGQTAQPPQTGAGLTRLRARGFSPPSTAGTATPPATAAATGSTVPASANQPTAALGTGSNLANGGASQSSGTLDPVPGVQYYPQLACREHYYFHGDDPNMPRICGTADKNEYACEGECTGGLTCDVCVDLDDPALQDPAQDPSQQAAGTDPTQQAAGTDPTQQAPGTDPTQQAPGTDPTQQVTAPAPTQQAPGGEPPTQGQSTAQGLSSQPVQATPQGQ